MREIQGKYDEIRAQAAAHPWENEYLKIILTDRRITPLISDFIHETARARGSTVMELTSEFSAFTGNAVFKGTKEMHEKPVEELFADFYRDRNHGVEAEEKDLELMAYVGELTRNAAAAREEPDEKEFRKILDFVLRQEVGRK